MVNSDICSVFDCVIAPSDFVFKLTVLTFETLDYFAVKTARSYLQLFCHNTLASQTTDRQTDRQHLMTIAELCNAIATFRSNRYRGDRL